MPMHMKKRKPKTVYDHTDWGFCVHEESDEESCESRLEEGTDTLKYEMDDVVERDTHVGEFYAKLSWAADYLNDVLPQRLMNDIEAAAQCHAPFLFPGNEFCHTDVSIATINKDAEWTHLIDDIESFYELETKESHISELSMEPAAAVSKFVDAKKKHSVKKRAIHIHTKVEEQRKKKLKAIYLLKALQEFHMRKQKAAEQTRENAEKEAREKAADVIRLEKERKEKEETAVAAKHTVALLEKERIEKEKAAAAAAAKAAAEVDSKNKAEEATRLKTLEKERLQKEEARLKVQIKKEAEKAARLNAREKAKKEEAKAKAEMKKKAEEIARLKFLGKEQLATEEARLKAEIKEKEEDIAKMKFLVKDTLIANDEAIEVAIDVAQLNALQEEARRKKAKIAFLKAKAIKIAFLKVKAEEVAQKTMESKAEEVSQKAMESTSNNHQRSTSKNAQQDHRDDCSIGESEVTLKMSSRSRDAAVTVISRRDNSSNDEKDPPSKTSTNRLEKLFKKKSVFSPFFVIQKEYKAEIQHLPHSQSACDKLLNQPRQSSVKFVI